MKKTNYILECLLAALIFFGGCACYSSILEKYHALSSLDLYGIQTGQVLYSIGPVF